MYQFQKSMLLFCYFFCKNPLVCFFTKMKNRNSKKSINKLLVAFKKNPLLIQLSDEIWAQILAHCDTCSILLRIRCVCRYFFSLIEESKQGKKKKQARVVSQLIFEHVHFLEHESSQVEAPFLRALVETYGSSIRVADFSNCSNLTPNLLQQVTDACPNLQVLVVRKCDRLQKATKKQIWPTSIQALHADFEVYNLQYQEMTQLRCLSCVQYATVDVLQLNKLKQLDLGSIRHEFIRLYITLTEIYLITDAMPELERLRYVAIVFA